MTDMPLATNNFLIPNGTFIVVLLAFLLVLGVIGRYVLPVLNKALTERQAKLKAEADAQAIHDRIVQTADAEVVIARQAAVEEVTASVGAIVLAAAERVIGREIQAADHRDLIDEAIAAVRAESADTAAAGGSR